MSRISHSISNSVTLGTAGYGSPLTITDQGSIAPTAPGANGVVVPPNYGGATIVNHGYIGGAYGRHPYKPGGAAIYSASNLSLRNLNDIRGGMGGPAPGGQAALGGNGVDVIGAAIVTNPGQIIGGVGGYGFYGGSGGIGINIDGSLRLTNAGTISGGLGGNAYGGNYSGNGGTGIYVDGSIMLTNVGTISGGIGGSDGYFAGSGGTGVDISGFGTIINHGVIAGGAPGSGLIDGGNGAGVVMVSGGTVVNSGVIGGAVTVGADSRVVNSGSIVVGYLGPDGLDAGINSTIVNSGLIEGGGRFKDQSGVNIAGGTLINKDGAKIVGAVGVFFQDDGTLVNAGYIRGSADAIQFSGSESTLVIDPGAEFVGKVHAPGGTGDVLELAGKTAGTLQLLDGQFIGFGTVEENIGADWTLTGTNRLGEGDALFDSGILQVSGSLTGAGSVAVEKHGVLAASGTGTIISDNVTLANGTISAGAQSVFVIGTTTAGAAAGSITIDSGATLAGNGWIVAAPLVDNGTLTAQDGILRLQSDVSGSGVLTISADASVYARYTLGVSSIDFAAGGKEDLLATPGGVTGTISGFSTGDTIDIRPVEATTLSFLSGTLTLLDGTTPVDELSLQGSYTTANFSLQSDGHGGFDIGYVPNGEHATLTNAAPEARAPAMWGDTTSAGFWSTPELFPHFAHW